jgi:hypothetical protein
LHEELVVRYFGISEHGVLRSVEKWDRRSCEIMKRILTIGYEETRGSKLENLGVRGPEELGVE